MSGFVTLMSRPWIASVTGGVAMRSTVPRPLTSGPAAVYDAPVIPETGPRSYETQLWFVARFPVYGGIAWGLDRLPADDLGPSMGFGWLSAFLITFGVSVSIVRWLRRRDA